MEKRFLTLGIETSCDETSAAVLEGPHTLLSNVVASQEKIHARFGGVVPEIAARKHVEAINHIIAAALEEAGAGFGDIDLIAVTTGPGLAVSLLVGISAARALSHSLGVPAVGVSHLEGHLLANCVGGAGVDFPAVCLLVSGGHTEIIYVAGMGDYEPIGSTVDDAAGEAFDKVARALGLGYPGGPAIQRAAAAGDPKKISFPRPMLRENNFNFSFSGLKTAVINHIRVNGLAASGEDGATAEDVAAAFQEAVADVLTEKTLRAAEDRGAGDVWLGGGVAANKRLRERLREESLRRGFGFFSPPMTLCTDNAGMIAKAGYEIYSRGGALPGLLANPSMGLKSG